MDYCINRRRNLAKAGLLFFNNIYLLLSNIPNHIMHYHYKMEFYGRNTFF